MNHSKIHKNESRLENRREIWLKLSNHLVFLPASTFSDLKAERNALRSVSYRGCARCASSMARIFSQLIYAGALEMMHRLTSQASKSLTGCVLYLLPEPSPFGQVPPVGKALDAVLVEEWLQRIVPYVEAGLVEWKTLPEIYDAYIDWEN